MTLLGPWGVLPVVAPLFAFIAARLGALAFGAERSDGRASVGDRAVAGVLLAFALVIATVRLLSFVHQVRPDVMLALLAVVAGALAVTDRDVRFVWPGGAVLRDAGTTSALCVAGAAIVVAVVAARWLPIWQWDALGYHLPIVHFTLAARSVNGVPRELEYIGSYPHDVELFFVALRACLPDDRLIDLGQVPFGLAGGIVTAALARRCGASAGAALLSGAAWVVIPAVFLQMPTDYVDVASATFCLAAVYFALAPRPSAASLTLGGLAIGLLAGSKPTGPVPGALLLGILCVRGIRARRGISVTSALALAFVFGSESYVENLIRHANPLWPMALDVGPLHLPGTHPLAELLSAGANAPHLTGPVPWRMVRGFLALSSPPSFDMRIGGFGVAALCAFPLAMVWLVRQRSLATWVAFACPLACPDPAVARYVLAFPALLLAAAAAHVASERVPARTRMAIGGAVAALGAVQLLYAAPGLTGEGPPLLAYAGMSDDERALAVGADGRPLAIAAARSRVGPGETLAFDESLDLCDLAWDSRQSYRVEFLPASLEGERLATELARAGVRVLIAGDAGPAAVWGATHPEAFERLSGRPSCRKGACSIYVRR